MKRFWTCRRTFVSIIAIICLTYIAIVHNIDVSVSIAGIAAANVGGNAYEKVHCKHEQKE